MLPGTLVPGCRRERRDVGWRRELRGSGMAPGVRRPRARLLGLLSVLLVVTSPGSLMAQSPAMSAPAPSWKPLVTLTSSGYRIDQVRMAVHPDGTHTVVWIQQSRVDTPNDGWNHRVMAVDVTPSGASEPVVLGGIPTSIIDEDEGLDPDPEGPGLQLAIDAAGLTTVVWSERRTDGNGSPIWGPHVMEVHRTGLGAWSAPAQLSTRRGLHPKLAASAAGHAVVVWRSLRRNVSFSAYRVPGGAWQTPVQAPSFGSAPSIGVDNAGHVLVASSSGMGVRVSRLTGEGSTWVEQTVLGERIVGPVDLAVNGRGDAMVTWERHWGPPHGEGWEQVESASKPSGGRWGRVRHVSAPRPRSSELRPKVVLDRGGRAVASWVQGEDQLVKVARLGTSGAWLRPETDGRRAVRPNINANNRRGDTLVSWLVRRDRVTRVDAAYRARGGSWQGLRLVSPKETSAGGWGVATVAPGGNAALAWPSVGRWPAFSRRTFFRELAASGGS